MRSEKQMLDSFMPLHEKEWEARLFIDEAIKNKTEYTLEAIARALSGKSNIKFAYAEKDNPFEHTEHIEGDDKKWITKTNKYGIEARMSEFVFYGNTKTDLWLKIIDFWAGKVTVFPCGGASFPNEKFTCVHEDDLKREGAHLVCRTFFPDNTSIIPTMQILRKRTMAALRQQFKNKIRAMKRVPNPIYSGTMIVDDGYDFCPVGTYN